jgi:hypothetical protein
MPPVIRDTPFWNPVKVPMALFGTVHIPRAIRERLEASDPERLKDLVDHEMVHVARQHALGMLGWHLRYALSPRFRWNEEKAAYWTSIRRRLLRGDRLGPVERDRFAAVLAGRAYFWMCSKPEARAFLDAVIESVATEARPVVQKGPLP